ncbi:hypothetical protein B7463_g1277, partial [Scytalidium lignicola]
MASRSSSEVSPPADSIHREPRVPDTIKSVYFENADVLEEQTCKVRTRVEQLEQGFEGIVSLFSTNQQHVASEQNGYTVHTPPSSTAPPRKSFSGPSSSRNESLAGDVFDRGLIILEEAIPLCASYRHMSQRHFPYVLLPDDVEINQLRIDKPFCLQAILIVASWQNPSLQILLEEQFLLDFSTRFFFRPEQTVDMVQALLVYLGWYHFVIKTSQSHQAYRLASVAATILMQLNLHKRPRDVKVNIFWSQAAVQVEQPDSPEFWSIDARRALLGCYCICAVTSTAVRRPNPLPYNEYMEECALSLQKEQLAPSDVSLSHYLRLHHLSEEIADAFNFGDSQTGVLSETKIKICVSEFDRQITKVRNELSCEPTQLAELNIKCVVLRAYAHQIAIFNNPDSNLLVSQIKMLYDCASAAKSYLDEIMLLSQEDMEEWSYMEWIQLNHIVQLIIRVAQMVGTSDWSDVVSRLMVLDSYLEWLCERLRGINNLRNYPETEENRSGLQYLFSVWEAMKNKNRSSLSALQSRQSAVLEMGQTNIISSQPAAVPNVSISVDYADLMSFGPLNLGTNAFWIPSNFPS